MVFGVSAGKGGTGRGQTRGNSLLDSQPPAFEASPCWLCGSHPPTLGHSPLLPSRHGVCALPSLTLLCLAMLCLQTELRHAVLSCAVLY